MGMMLNRLIVMVISITNTNIKSLYCIPETTIMLYISYITIKKNFK